MREFVIKIENKIGALADVLELFAKASININAISAESHKNVAVIKLIVNNEDLAKEAMTAAGLDFKEHEMVSIKVRDMPGELAKITRAISNLGIDIKTVFFVDKKDGRAEIALRVDNLTEVKNLFK